MAPHDVNFLETSQTKNPFESGQRKVIPAVLVYVFREHKVLMIHRNAQTSGQVDYHQGKWNGLGGKLEADESPLQGAMRELKEESGLDLPAERFRPMGVLQFPNFKPHKKEDWIVFVFVAHLIQEDPQKIHSSCPEGELHWIPVQDLSRLNLWAGDHYFISYLQPEAPFIGTIWYVENNKLTPDAQTTSQVSKVKNYWIQKF